jgi:hypothetical protein
MTMLAAVSTGKAGEASLGDSHQYSGVSQSGTEGKMRAVVLFVSMMTCLHPAANACNQVVCRYSSSGHNLHATILQQRTATDTMTAVLWDTKHDSGSAAGCCWLWRLGFLRLPRTC